MNGNGKVTSVVLLTAALTWSALAGCAREPEPGAPSPPTATTSSSPATPGPVPSATPSKPAPPTTTAPTSGTKVVSVRLAHQWVWPNVDANGAVVKHSYTVPPAPQLVRIGVGDHPRDPGEPPYNRMSFTFNTTFPSYEFLFVQPPLVGDPSGKPVPIEGYGVLKVTFRGAQAHAANGSSTIISQPPAHLGLSRMVSYAAAGDYEGVVTYGIGISYPIQHSNPQIAVRAYEVKMRTSRGEYLYVVAIDVDAS